MVEYSTDITELERPWPVPRPMIRLEGIPNGIAALACC